MLVFGVAALLAGPVGAEEGAVEKTPELRGVLAEGTNKRFGLFIPGSGQTGWATLGQTVGGWKLKEYRAADEVLVLAKGDREEILRLSENVVGAYHAGTPADAKALLEAMKYEQQIRRMDWLMPRQMLTSSGLPNPSAAQLAEFEKEISRLFDYAKMQTLMTGVVGKVYTQEELRAQVAFYSSEAGQVVLDQQMRDSQGLNEKEPTALTEFYATPVGRSVKAKQGLVESELYKALTPWMNKTMIVIKESAIAYAKAQAKAAPVSGP